MIPLSICLLVPLGKRHCQKFPLFGCTDAALIAGSGGHGQLGRDNAPHFQEVLKDMVQLNSKFTMRLIFSHVFLDFFNVRTSLNTRFQREQRNSPSSVTLESLFQVAGYDLIK